MRPVLRLTGEAPGRSAIGESGVCMEVILVRFKMRRQKEGVKASPAEPALEPDDAPFEWGHSSAFPPGQAPGETKRAARAPKPAPRNAKKPTIPVERKTAEMFMILSVTQQGRSRQCGGGGAGPAYARRFNTASGRADEFDGVCRIPSGVYDDHRLAVGIAASGGLAATAARG